MELIKGKSHQHLTLPLRLVAKIQTFGMSDDFDNPAPRYVFHLQNQTVGAQVQLDVTREIWEALEADGQELTFEWVGWSDVDD